MDSMRSLNTSLPKNMPPDLLAAFRTAALSVTNLYKAAAASDSSSHQAGYQDALEDLLVFLDKENLGLQDGEGWVVRQWATEKFDRELPTNQSNDSDEEQAEADKERSTSPARSSISNDEDTGASTILPPRSASAPAQEQPQPLSEEILASNDMYRFTGIPPTPQDTQMQAFDSLPQIEEPVPSIITQSSSESPIRVEVVGRGSRTPHRHAGLRHGTRQTTRDFTFSAGTKRKVQFPDFFDISNLGTGGDASHGRGGKKGRFA
jgi:Domain of unknown function (DUF4588)